MLAQVAGEIQRCRTSRIILEQVVHLGHEAFLVLPALVGGLELIEGRNQHLGNVASAILSVETLLIRQRDTATILLLIFIDHI